MGRERSVKPDLNATIKMIVVVGDDSLSRGLSRYGKSNAETGLSTPENWILAIVDDFRCRVWSRGRKSSAKTGLNATIDLIVALAEVIEVVANSRLVTVEVSRAHIDWAIIICCSD